MLSDPIHSNSIQAFSVRSFCNHTITLRRLTTKGTSSSHSIQPILRRSVPPRRSRRVRLVIRLTRRLRSLNPSNITRNELHLDNPTNLISTFRATKRDLSITITTQRKKGTLNNINNVNLRHNRFIRFRRLRPLNYPMPPRPYLFLFMNRCDSSAQAGAPRKSSRGFSAVSLRAYTSSTRGYEQIVSSLETFSELSISNFTIHRLPFLQPSTKGRRLADEHAKQPTKVNFSNT